MKVRIIDGVLRYNYEDAKKIVKLNGLRSEKTRHIKKRYKKLIIEALWRLKDERD